MVAHLGCAVSNGRIVRPRALICTAGGASLGKSLKH